MGLLQWVSNRGWVVIFFYRRGFVFVFVFVCVCVCVCVCGLWILLEVEGA